MPVERVREILKISQEPVSLETPIGEEEDSHLGDFIQDDNVPVPADAAAFTLLKEQLEEVLGTLTEREQKVLTLRFGLEDGRARTLEEVGKEFNVTRERIRQIYGNNIRTFKNGGRTHRRGRAAGGCGNRSRVCTDLSGGTKAHPQCDCDGYPDGTAGACQGTHPDVRHGRLHTDSSVGRRCGAKAG